MGIAYNSSIVTSGLVLALDAANTKSILSAVEVLVVAGGGGGGSDMGGGGGGGGVLYSSAVSITPGSAITATVGAGGAGAPAGVGQIKGSNGTNSSFGSFLISIGGGGGASCHDRSSSPAGDGGSGGGASGGGTLPSGGSGGGGYGGGIRGLGTAGQGNNGGTGIYTWYPGGGGGAGAAGGTNPAKGGDGIQNSILETSYYWGGGGGGSGYSGIGGNGGNGGGGGGAVGTTVGGAGLNNGSPGGGGNPNSSANTPGGNAGANTGGGGGGGSHYNANNKGGDGGSGIVIVRYPGSQRATGGTVTSVGGYTIHTFTTSGTFTPTWGDLSGNGNTGTLTNGPTYNSANSGSIVFDGVDDRVSTNYKPSGERSYFIWVKFSSLTHSSGYSLTGTQEINAYTYIGIQNGGDVYYYAGASTGGNLGNPVTVNTWVNLGFVLNADGSRIVYKNGVNIHSNTGGLGGTATREFSVGCINNAYHVNGNIAQVSIYNRALSAAEVSQNFNALKSRYGL